MREHADGNLEFVFGWNPNYRSRLIADYFLHFGVNLLWRVSLNDGCFECIFINSFIQCLKIVVPVKYSPNSCSSFRALSKVFRA